MPRKRKPNDEDDWRNCPSLWLVKLMDAKQRRDVEKEAEATRELRRLGVEVVFHRPKEPRLLPGGVK